MLYVANFSYSVFDEEFENACLMPAVVDAPDFETAVERFKAMLQKYHEESPLLDGAELIYLDSIVELTEAPTEPLVIQWQKVVASDEGLYSDVVALPGREEIARICGQDDDGEDDEGELISLVDDDDADEDAEGLTDGGDEMTLENLADAISEALDLLMGNDLDYLGDEDLTASEEPFLVFED